MSDVASDGYNAGDAKIHHAGSHEKCPPASNETAQGAADESEQDYLQGSRQVYLNKMLEHKRHKTVPL